MSDLDLAKEVEKLKAQNKKLKEKLKPKESYVLKHEKLFAEIWEVLQKFPTDDGKLKYFFTRKPKEKKDAEEEVFKLNLFVKHLIEYKVRTNKKVPVDKVNTRISMDVAALIISLKEGRVKRPRKAGKGIDTKPTKKPATKAKEKPDLPNLPETEIKAKDEPAVRSVTIEDDQAVTAGGKDWQTNRPSFGED